ncbi:MAG: FtsX-like permease family protein [Candidatus Firestonebacteria bacterium]
MEQEKIGKQITLPLSDAVKISFNSLKIRFGRSIITMGGIFLGIAFLISVLAGSAISSSLAIESDPDMKVKQTWLVILSLLVCVLGITNSMLMSVSERYKEIGTMKCLGALDKFVVELFILEAAFQGIVGSIGGSLFGVLSISILYLIKNGWKVIICYPLIKIIIYILISIILGIVLSVIGCIYPAYKAAKMVPADAMRTEV